MAAPVMVLADHPLATAIPFFAPSLLIVGVIGALMVRDRRRHRKDDRPHDARDYDPDRPER